jgi:peptide/nickel transport system permease protein
MSMAAEFAPYLEASGRRGAIRRFRRNGLGWLGGAMVGAVLVMALVGPAVAPYDPAEINVLEKHRGPSSDHLLGTDFLGRDQLSRLLHGAQRSVLAAVGLMAVIIVVATVVGLSAGYLGGVVDALLMRIVDVVLAFPSLVLALAIAGFLGPGLENALIALAGVWWAGHARIIRGQVLAVRNRGFIEAAEAGGGTGLAIVRRHILPNVASTITVLATLDVGVIILALAGLSFLGLGAQPPAAEWGRMLFDAKAYIEVQPFEMVVPGVAIAVTVLGFNLLGDALRDALDPAGGIRA